MLVPPSPESELEFDLFTGTVKLFHVMAKSIQSSSGHAILAVAAFRRRQEWQGASRHCVLSVLRISFVAIDSFCGPHKEDLIASSVDTEFQRAALGTPIVDSSIRLLLLLLQGLH